MTWFDRTYLHLTPDDIAGCMPGCPSPEKWASAFDDAIRWHGGEVDVAMLFTQVGHESSDLTRLEENLNYSAERLMVVWPSRFPDLATAKRFAGDPEALANRVYGDRLGNTFPGDGWRFRGHGPIQVTGRDNYARLARDTGLNAIGDPDCLLRPAGGALSALWYWKLRLKPGMSLEAATRAINGGVNGLADRRARYERCREVLS